MLCLRAWQISSQINVYLTRYNLAERLGRSLEVFSECVCGFFVTVPKKDYVK